MSWAPQPQLPAALSPTRAASPDYVSYGVQVHSPRSAAEVPRGLSDRLKAFWISYSRLIYVLFGIAVCLVIVILILVYTQGGGTNHDDYGPVAACDNLYHFSCNPWLKTQSPSRYYHMKLTAVQDHNDQITDNMFNSLSQLHPAVQSLYASCSDIQGVYNAGLNPLIPYLDRLKVVTTWAQYWALLGSFRLDFYTEAFMRIEVKRGHYDSGKVTRLYLEQGGLTLDDTLYTSPSSMALYQNEISRAFLSVGDSPSVASQNAALVVQFERLLSQAWERSSSWTTYDVANWDQVFARTGTWTKTYLDGAQVPIQNGVNFRLNIYTPSYFTQLTPLINTLNPTQQHMQYARWRLINSTAAYLPVGWSASSDRMEPTLGGLSKPAIERHRIEKPHHAYPQTPRVLRTPNNLGDDWSFYCQYVVQEEELTSDVFGESFTSRTFPLQARAYVVSQVLAMKQALISWLPSLTWTDTFSRTALRNKIETMEYFIGGPAPSDYTAILPNLRNTGSQFFENTRLIRRMQETNRFSYMNKPWNNDLNWDRTASTVNAMYWRGNNAFYLFAGILQQPAFQVSADPFVQLRNMAWLYFIAHEAGHGLDYHGIRFNAQGVPSSTWLTSTTFAAFERQIPCLVNSYSGLSDMGVNVDGQNTLDENIADIVAVRMATHLFKEWQAAHNQTTLVIPVNFEPQVDTLEQFFWVLLAQNHCEMTSRWRLEYNVAYDVHSPEFARANGPAVNNEDFGKAFGCQRGQDMYPKNQCFLY